MRMSQRGRKILSGALRRNATSGVQNKHVIIGVKRPSDAENYVIYQQTGDLYYGPSVDGGDEGYIRVVSGKINRRIPSFAMNYGSN